jgi:hypothetical protein
MLVLVENFRSGSTAELDADMLTRYLNDELTAHNIAPIIEFEQLATLRTDTTKNFREMSIDAIGRTLGAKQILYVDLISSNVLCADRRRNISRSRRCACENCRRRHRRHALAAGHDRRHTGHVSELPRYQPTKAAPTRCASAKSARSVSRTHRAPVLQSGHRKT